MIHEDASQVLNLHDKELLLVLSNVGMEMGRGKRERENGKEEGREKREEKENDHNDLQIFPATSIRLLSI